MKPFLAILLLWWTTQWAYCATPDSASNGSKSVVPVPMARPLDLSGVTEADIIATVQHMQRLVHDAEGRQLSAEASASDLTLQLRTVREESAKNEAIIAAQAKQLADLKTFAHVVLACIFALGFVTAWKLLPSLNISGPWGIAIRIAICLAAGALASGAVWRIITRLL